ncbi:TetR/AcrR family transcriptional regulator [Promicromonospora thailandica]|uniref:Transcriptional regulator, TetR family n=1 Tax=Promicromonospora thailandica TaxID=765201 RepID=A0A9X2G6Y7_9MICO|nr:TetR/AcrR family transcriptional regulator [Promicromonospora thailandica]MCP2266698.1 transcriptional regulator, TetR family [Promicromonospora thailandica]BFF17213.1 TetR/AcrR family transcriptional regulator [Promicromonospora thailandica]
MTSDLTWGRPRPERADAARNRQVLLDTARTLLAEGGPGLLTMDLLAERSGLGKGTVFRRFGSRAGIFQALLDDSERDLQREVLSGPPPLGPGAPPADRLLAYGIARIRFLARNQAVARATLDGRQEPGARRPLSAIHIRVLLREAGLTGVDVDVLAVQLTHALDGPMMLQVFGEHAPDDPPPTARLEQGWRYLVERLVGPVGDP